MKGIGRPTRGEVTQKVTASELSRGGSGGLIQTTLSFTTTSSLGINRPSISINNSTISIGGNVTINVATGHTLSGPIVTSTSTTNATTKSKDTEIIDIDSGDDNDGQKLGEKRPRSSSPHLPVDLVYERVKLEEKVATETGFNSYYDHRKDIMEKLEKEEDNTRREALLKDLEELNIIWKNTCPELMEAKKDTHATTSPSQPTMTRKYKKKVRNPSAPPALHGKTSSEEGKSKVHDYSPEQKQRCLDKEDECMASDDPKMRTPKAIIQQIRQWPGFQSVCWKSLQFWRKYGIYRKKRTGGQKVSLNFDQAVLSKLIYTQRNSNSEEVVLANISYSHAVIQKAALLTRDEPRWKENEDLWKKLEPMTFSPTWCTRFLDDMRMTKRRITNIVKKNLPSEAEVLSQMKGIQEQVTNGGWREGDVSKAQPYSRRLTVNCDETATHYSAQFQHQWVPKGTDRGSAPAADEKRRFTSMIGGSADGEVLPTFNIITCTVKQDQKASNYGDLTSSTILRSIYEKIPGFRGDDGWESRVWVKSLPSKIPDLPNVTYKRPYLIHKDKGTVITIHNNAWMDSPGLVMWADLVLKPWAKGQRMLLVWDNCPSHKTDDVVNYFQSLDIEVAYLPPNMTDKLQPMDLCINGPLKSYMRRFRGEDTFDYMQQFQKDSREALEKNNPQPLFSPPLPKIHDGLLMFLKAMKQMCESDGFSAGLQRIFIKVGLALDPARDNTFRPYSGLSNVALTQNEIRDKVLGSDQAENPTLGSLVFECSFSRTESDGWLDDNYTVDHETGLASGSV